jgi:uncharacterized membrane protein YfcA
MTLTAVALASAVGVAMGLFGGGGSLLLVPSLTYLMGFETKQAVATSLAVVGISAAAGAAAARVRGTLPWRPAVTVGLTTMIGAFAGGIVGARVDDAVQLTIFAIVTCIAALILAWQSTTRQGAPPAGVPRPAVLMMTGVGVGFVTGLVGVGGGFLIVPALVTAAGLDMREATSVSLFAMMLATTAALVGYAGRVSVSWAFVLPFAGLAAIGTIVGGHAGHAMPQRLLQQVFAGTLIAVAAFVLIRG